MGLQIQVSQCQPAAELFKGEVSSILWIALQNAVSVLLFVANCCSGGHR
jgi:hypothetical protein